MNYKKRDDELIKLNKQARAKNSVGNNSGNVGYTNKAFESRRKLPVVTNSPNKATTQANTPVNNKKSVNLKDKGYSSSTRNDEIDFDYVLKNDKYWGNHLNSDLDFRNSYGYREDEAPIIKLPQKVDAFLKKTLPQDNTSKDYYNRFGMSKDKVLDKYEKYLRETHPIKSGLKDFETAPDRALLGAAGMAAHQMFPESDLDKFVNSDLVQRKVKDVQKKRDYVYNSDKLTDKQKQLSKGVSETGDLISNLLFNALVGGTGFAPQALTSATTGAQMGTTGATALGQSFPKLMQLANGVSSYGLMSQNAKHDLERQGVDSETASNYGNAEGLIWGGIDALTAGAGSKIGKGAAATGKILPSVLKGMGVGGGMGITRQGLSELANKLILGDQANYNRDIQNYTSQGMSEDEAKQKAFTNILGRVGQSGLWGMILGGTSELVSQGLNRSVNPTVNQGVPSAGASAGAEYFNEATPNGYTYNNRPLLTQIDALPDNGTPIPSIEGMMPLGLPKKQLPSDAIRMPGTQGIINLPGQTEPIYLPETQVQSNVVPIETGRENNPRVDTPLTEEQRAVAQSDLDAIRTEKKLMQEELDGYKNKKRLTKEQKARRDLLKDRISEHTKEETKLSNQLKGKGMSIKDLLKSEDYPAYKSIFDWQKDNSTTAKINNIVKFAGNTPEAKELGKKMNNLIAEFLETGDSNTLLDGGFAESANRLDQLAKESNIIPFGDVSYLDRYTNNYDPEHNPSIWDFLVDDISNIRTISNRMNEKYPMPQAETPVPISVPVENTSLVPQLEPNFTMSDVPINNMFDLDLQFFAKGQEPNGGYWLRLLGDSDFLQQEAQKNNVTPEVLRQYANYNLGYDETPKNNAPKQEAKPDNSYWTKVLSDDSFLQSEAQKHNVTPDVLRNYANMNLGNTTNNGGGKRRSFFDNNNMPGGNVPPNNNGGNNVPPNNGRPINLTQDENGNVVESGTSRHIKGDDTAMRYDNVSDEVIDDFIKNPGMYKRLKNKDTKALADAIYNSGDTPVVLNGRTYSGDVESKFRNLLSEKNPAALPLGAKIAADYSAKGNHAMASQIFRDMESSLTDAGRFSQAAVINMTKNDPLTALAYMEKEIDALNRAGADKYGRKWKDFVLTDAERQMFDNIKAGDTDAIRKAYEKVGARIEKEYPSTAWEKVLEFRRVAMLLNSRTIMRNLFANVPTAGMRYVSDRIEGIGQYIAYLIDPTFERTQAVRGSNLATRRIATEIFNSDRVQNMLKNVPGRLSEVPKVGDYAKSKQMYKGWIVSDLINNLTGGGIEKLNAKLGKEGAKSVLELARNAAYSALEVTDAPFVRENFVSRLGSYMRAKGINNVNDVPDEAIKIALEEALKATYKDDSWLVQGIKGFKTGIAKLGNGIMPGIKLGDMASQALIPFVQAPGNIGARIVDYSGVGGVKGIADIIGGANKGDADQIRKGIEEFSKGITGGLGLLLLGKALYKAGIITGAESDDKDQRAFDKKNGFREFAIKYVSPIDGKVKYDTIDWMQPFIDDLMAGVLLQQSLDNADEYDSDILRYFGKEGTKLGKAIGVGRETARKNINYFFDATPLQNLSDLFKSNYGEDTDIAGNLWENTVEDFGTAMIPAAANAVAKSVDPVQRQTYNPDNAFSTFLNSAAARIPFLSKKLPVKYDIWGEPVTYGRNKGEAAFGKLLYPGEHTTDTADEIDNEISRLYAETNEVGVFPQVAPNKVGEEKLNNKEQSQYQELMGKRNRQATEAFFNSEYYDSLSDSVKAKVLTDIYSASKNIADYEVKGKEIGETYAKAAEAYDKYGAEGLVNYYYGNAAVKALCDETGIGSSTNAAKEIKALYQEGNYKEAQKKSEEAARDNAEREQYNAENGTNIGLADWQKNHSDTTPTTSTQSTSTPTTTTPKASTTTRPTVTETIQPSKRPHPIGSETTSNEKASVETAKYQKQIDRAGSQKRKFENDLPTLVGMGAAKPETYTYAYAINQDPSLNVKTYHDTYTKLNYDRKNAVSQQDMINYFNANNISEKQGMYYWTTYGEKNGEPWKTLPTLSNGKWKK